MTTNEERREVAERLRGSAPGSDWPNFIAKSIGLDPSKMSNNFHFFTEELCSRIADLIEPEPERKAKSKPFPVEKDTGYFDTTLCECGYLNDVSATYCGQCGCVIEVVHYAN